MTIKNNQSIIKDKIANRVDLLFQVFFIVWALMFNIKMKHKIQNTRIEIQKERIISKVFC